MTKSMLDKIKEINIPVGTPIEVTEGNEQEKKLFYFAEISNSGLYVRDKMIENDNYSLPMKPLSLSKIQNITILEPKKYAFELPGK